MKNLIVLLLFLAHFIYGDILDDKIKNIIGEDNYSLHKKLIDNSFKEKDLFFYKDTINYVKVFRVLKEQGLLEQVLKKLKRRQVVKNNENSE